MRLLKPFCTHEVGQPTRVGDTPDGRHGRDIELEPLEGSSPVFGPSSQQLSLLFRLVQFCFLCVLVLVTCSQSPLIVWGD